MMNKSKFIFLVMLASYCSLLYELLLAHTLGLLFGDTVVQYSITIGIYLFSLGLGSYFTDRLKNHTRGLFWVEIGLSIIGSLAPFFLLFNQDVILFSKLHGFGLSLWVWNVIFYIPVLVIGVMSGMELPLFYRLAEGKRALAKVLAYDYYGSLFAAVLFPIVLLPRFGLIGVSIMTGMVNLVIAYFMLRTKRLKRYYWIVLGVLFVVLSVLLFNQAGLQETVNEKFVSSVFRTEYKEFEDHIDLIKVEQSPYQSFYFGKRDTSLDGKREDSYFLILDKEFQMESSVEKNYHEPYVHPLFCIYPVKDVLIIGGGDGMLTREVLKYPGVERIDHVDIDSMVTDFFRTNEIATMLNENSLNDPRVNVLNEDGFSYLKGVDHQYDVVMFDLPSPIYEIVARFHSEEVYGLVKNRLKDNGFFVTHTAKNHVPYQAANLDAAGFSYLQQYKVDVWQRYLLAANFDFDYAEYSENWFCDGVGVAFEDSIHHTMLDGRFDLPIEYDDSHLNSIYKPNIKFFREPYGN